MFVSGFLLRAESTGVVLRFRGWRVRRVVRVGRPRGRRKGGIEGGILGLGPWFCIGRIGGEDEMDEMDVFLRCGCAMAVGVARYVH